MKSPVLTESKPLILIIDDEMILYELLSMVCPSYTYRWWDNCADGIKSIHAHGSSLSLVILDYDLSGGMNGLEALEEIRLTWPHLPVLMWSGNHDIEAEALAKGASAFLKKPLDPTVIEEAIDELLQKGKQR